LLPSPRTPQGKRTRGMPVIVLTALRMKRWRGRALQTSRKCASYLE
jgi:hypothetical protein